MQLSGGGGRAPLHDLAVPQAAHRRRGMETFAIISIAGGSAIAALAICVLGVACLWDPTLGFRRKGQRKAFAGKIPHGSTNCCQALSRGLHA